MRSPEGLAVLLEDLLEATPADRASVTRFDPAGRQCRIETTAGETLVARGGTMPIECSTNFLTALEGETFICADLQALDEYDRGWDQVTRAAGLRSTCSVPLVLGNRSAGAISFSSPDRGVRFDDAIEAVLDVSDQLILALLGEPREEHITKRVLICLDDSLSAEGLARVVSRVLEVDAEICHSIEEAAHRVVDETDLIITDSFVRGTRIDDQAEFLRRREARARVVVVSSFDTESNRIASVRAGVMGYVPRDAAIAEISQTLVRVGAGEPLSHYRSDRVEDDLHEPLTFREGQMLVMLERGLQVKEIAFRLGISDSTAKGYVRNVFTKLEVHSATAAIYQARRSGLLQSLQTLVPEV
jgi:DNA-binding NarL/FixJ family response regulator